MIGLFDEMEAALNAARPGLMVDLVRAGIISPTIKFYREVFLFYDKEIKTGEDKRQAKMNTATEFGIEESTVYRIIRTVQA